MPEPMKVYPSGHFQWKAVDDDTHASVRVSRMNWDTVGVSTSVMSSSIGYELTPDKAREMAAALILGADTVDAYLRAENKK